MMVYGWAGRQTRLAGVGGVQDHQLKPSYPEYLLVRMAMEQTEKNKKSGSGHGETGSWEGQRMPGGALAAANFEN